MTDATTEQHGGFRQLLRIPDFRRLWLGQIVSDFGDHLTFITLLFLVQRLTGSTVALAGVLIAATLPSLVFGLIAGVYADRLDRRKVMIVSDVLRGTLVLGLVVVRSADLMWLLYAITFAQASVATLFNPAKSALLPHIVGDDRLLAANSVSQTSRIMFNLLGTGAAGVFAGFMDELWPAFIIDSATFFVSAIMISRIRTSGAVDPAAAHATRAWGDLTTGIRVIIGSRPLAGMLLAAGVAMLGLGAVNVLLVPFLIEDLMISEAWFGLVEAAQVGGMILSGTAVVVLAARLRPTNLVSIGLGAIGIAVGLLGGVQAIWQLTAVLFLVGLFMTPLQSAVATLSQTLIADEMRGRVGGALNALISTATIVSMGFAGVAAATIGTRSVFVVAGGISILAAAISAAVFRGVDLAPAAPAPSPVSP